eukprot:CAMPEP_0198561596 /NCGR_PEP_ID=MMETSP1462-20131121/95746_1 /TAXON_ID=1333877 /ORGANISM="Brandtodinium nutriculum, Strain RCC3387" /LENGTH=127 /DNA_ID=CAMNT_0044292503 /DNA_START=3 /DNA_END=383 /DNA_ORIENTATION=+
MAERHNLYGEWERRVAQRMDDLQALISRKDAELERKDVELQANREMLDRLNLASQELEQWLQGSEAKCEALRVEATQAAARASSEAEELLLASEERHAARIAQLEARLAQQDELVASSAEVCGRSAE